MRIPIPGSLVDFLPPLPKSNENLYKTPRTNIGYTPDNHDSNATDYRAARQAVAKRIAKKPAPSNQSKAGGYGSASPGLVGGFASDMPSGGGSYLDIFNSIKGNDKTLADYMAEANKIYKPSLDYLTQQKKDATTRAGEFDKSLADMYAGLVSNIDAQSPIIAQNYNDAISGQNQITGNAKTAVGNNYANSQAQQMDMLKQLGIEAAAPDTLQTGQDSQAFFQSLLDTSGAGYDSFLNSQKVASQDFNTAQRNISAQTGVNARSDLKMQLQDILAQLSGKGADLQTQINQQAVQMQSGAAQALLDQQKALLDAAYKQDQTNIDLSRLTFDQQRAATADENAKARLALDKAKFDATPPKSSSSGVKIPSNPWGNAAVIAQNLYGNPTSAQNAIEAIQTAIRSLGTPADAQQLLDTVLRRVSPTGSPTGGGDTSSLQTLVDYLYKQLYG